ncbi:MAG: Lrp/AsnC ligand binding domain-containing protein [Candidatus Latescibacteria bacterium]|nr:Lrp/AsnC ligand binding domain-containing protein [Candidatus Latescibacterota bacterium]
MVATAYILITVAHGTAKKAYEQLSKIQGVAHVHAISGPYDIIAMIQGSDFNTLGNLIVNKIQPIEGIERTLTCNVIEFEQ